MIKKSKSLFGKDRSGIVGKRENHGYQHSILSINVFFFSKLFSPGSLKVKSVWLRVKKMNGDRDTGINLSTNGIPMQ